MKPSEYPRGFRLYRHKPNSFKVTYQTKGMGCMVTFLGTLLTITLVFFLSWFFRTPAQERATLLQEILANVFQNWVSATLALAGTLGGIFGYFGLLFVFFWKVFGITTFEIEPHILLVTKRLFGRQLAHRVLRAEMVELEQVKDGGKEKILSHLGV